MKYEGAITIKAGNGQGSKSPCSLLVLVHFTMKWNISTNLSLYCNNLLSFCGRLSLELM